MDLYRFLWLSPRNKSLPTYSFIFFFMFSDLNDLSKWAWLSTPSGLVIWPNNHSVIEENGIFAICSFLVYASIGEYAFPFAFRYYVMAEYSLRTILTGTIASGGRFLVIAIKTVDPNENIINKCENKDYCGADTIEPKNAEQICNTWFL